MKLKRLCYIWRRK